MEIGEFLRRYRKNHNLSVRKFAEMLDVSKFRLEKWEKGFLPNSEDSAQIRKYFGVDDFQNLSEEFLKSFRLSSVKLNINELIRLKDQIIEEKEKRIQALEETIDILRESQRISVGKKAG